MYFINKYTSEYEIVYETWFDTKNVFGNGEYQQYDNNNGGLDLYNMKYHSSIINSVTNYVEQDEKVFFKGYSYDNLKKCSFEVLAILSLKTNVVKYYVVDYKFVDNMIPYSNQMISDNKLIIINNFNEFDLEEQKILEGLS